MAPVPAGPYSHAVRAGDFVYVSGQVPRLVDGTYEPADVGTETRLTLNMSRPSRRRPAAGSPMP